MLGFRSLKKQGRVYLFYFLYRSKLIWVGFHFVWLVKKVSRYFCEMIYEIAGDAVVVRGI